MVMFTVSVLDSKRKLGPKKQNCLRWDLLPATLIRVSSFDDIHFFFVSDPKYAFWANLVLEIKIVCLS